MRLIIVSIILLLITGGCYDNHKEPPIEEFAKLANCNIAQLKQLCNDKCYNISSDMVCVGRVTSSDKSGNFYRSMVIEDSTGGLEILIGIYDIATQYPVGITVAIDLNGTAIMVENGVIQVGLPPQSFDSSPREFESQTVIDQHIKRSNSIETIEPLICKISSLDTSLCGRFIRIDTLQSSPIADDEESAMEGYHRFTDSEGNVIFSYTSAYADFADLNIPDTEISIKGILYHETVGMNIGKQFVLKPRFADDITTPHNTI